MEKMAEDWNNLVAILERDDKEFMRVMEAEVSTVFSRFSSKYKILAGVDIITQHQIDLPIFKHCLALLPWLLQLYKISLLSKDYIQTSVSMRSCCTCMNGNWGPDQKR